MAGPSFEELLDEFKKDPRKAIARATQWVKSITPRKPASINPQSATVTPIQGGYNAHVAVFIETVDGEELASIPMCEIYSYYDAIDDEPMNETFDPLLGSTYWTASFQGIYPKPNSAKITADFFSADGTVQQIITTMPVPF